MWEELHIEWRCARLGHVRCSQGCQAVEAGGGLLGAAFLEEGTTFKAQDMVGTSLEMSYMDCWLVRSFRCTGIWSPSQ